ncbi:hypothetical protein ACN5L9_001612 [Cronobacter sakazakii]|uniref:hypothetical protein n=1 Tax=Cronobacter sakazakii TaxID=28141 RepID=UPI000DA19F0C|nr:hypothetical protein [Cronobacter sakazakii]
MSELSKEHNSKLRELREELVCWQGYYDPVDDKEQHEMFVLAADAIAELLALRERAEPVYQVQAMDWHDVEKYLYDEALDRGIRCRVLYTAPPAPVVPDAIPETESKDGNDIDYMEPSAIYELGKTHGWNACRAAMLAAPGKER